MKLKTRSEAFDIRSITTGVKTVTNVKSENRSIPSNRTSKTKNKKSISSIVCMNCNREGHFYRNCFQPLDQKLIDKRLKERKEEKRINYLSKRYGNYGSTIEKLSDSLEIKNEVKGTVNRTITNNSSTSSQPVPENSRYILKNSSKLQKYINNEKSLEEFKVFPSYEYLFS